MTSPSTPAELRVAAVVGGHFTPDALGPAYNETIAAIRESPVEHLGAFERLYLSTDADLTHFADLHLPNLLQLLAPVAPEATRRIASSLEQRFASVARAQQAEIAAATEFSEADDVARRRRRLNARHDELRGLLG